MSSIRNSHSLQMGMKKIVTLDDSLEASYTTKHSYHKIVLPYIQLYSIQSSKHTPRYLPNWSENLCPHKNLYLNVCCNFIPGYKKLKPTKVSLNKWIVKLCYFLTMESDSTIKKNKLLIDATTWMNLTLHWAEWKKPVSKSSYSIIPFS